MIDESVARTIERIGTVAGVCGQNVKALWRGLSKEFGRFVEYRDLVKCAAVPSSSLCIDAVDDLEKKYGLLKDDGLTDAERIARIVERAALFGSGGKDWLESQIQAAGFPLYVIENVPMALVETQFGDVQFSDTTQFGIMPNRIDPETVDGILITSVAGQSGGAVILDSSQFGGTNQFGTTMFGTRDPGYSFPQPRARLMPRDPVYWPMVFFLSPFPDRLAALDELLVLSGDRYRYLIEMVQQIKHLHLWCVAQVLENIELITEDGYLLETEDGIRLVG